MHRLREIRSSEHCAVYQRLESVFVDKSKVWVLTTTPLQWLQKCCFDNNASWCTKQTHSACSLFWKTLRGVYYYGLAGSWDSLSAATVRIIGLTKISSARLDLPNNDGVIKFWGPHEIATPPRPQSPGNMGPPPWTWGPPFSDRFTLCQQLSMPVQKVPKHQCIMEKEVWFTYRRHFPCGMTTYRASVSKSRLYVNETRSCENEQKFS